MECRACGLTLVSAPHLARSYHYLFPVDPFKEIAFESNHSFCFGCQKSFAQKDKKVIDVIPPIYYYKRLLQKIIEVYDKLNGDLLKTNIF